MTWKKIGSKSIYQDYWKGLELWKMRSDKGVEKDISISLSRNTVVIFGITDDNRVLLINEYFFSQNKMVISLPAGMVNEKLVSALIFFLLEYLLFLFWVRIQ